MAPTRTATAIERIEQMCAGHTDRREEWSILELLVGMSKRELNQVLETIDVAKLLSDVDDRLFGPKHRRALLGILCRDRLDDLGVAARAAVVRALARGRTGRAAEHALRDLLTSTRGRDLEALKHAIECGGDHRDLHQLVFHDIDARATRETILAHFEREAVEGKDAPLRLLSDIDDTLYANWKDERYPKKTVYPGVLAFYAALSGHVCFVTARPGDRAGIVENATLRMLKERGVASATMLGGSVSGVLGNARIAARKFDNFLEYLRVWPRRRFAFVGDSGQGDVAFGARMLEHPSNSVSAVFIHDVVATPEDVRRQHAERRIFFFDTYVGAAVQARSLGLIDGRAVRRVAEATKAELAAVPFSSAAQRRARVAELERDLDAMSHVKGISTV
jgi:hypothetical protein